jgi:membrane protein YqaA with SNARE-associated domain
VNPDPAIPKPVTWWHYHRRLYNWMLSFAHSRYSVLALALFSFCEAVFFPVPPFVLQIPLSLERRARTWYYAAITTAASVLGGLGGYLVGHLFHGFALWLFGQSKLDTLGDWTGNPWVLTGGAIAIHPYKLYTIAAGFLEVPLHSFILASIIGRSVLFFAIALMLWLFGAPVRRFIDRYFNFLTIAFGVLIVGIVVAAKLL